MDILVQEWLPKIKIIPSMRLLAAVNPPSILTGENTDPQIGRLILSGVGRQPFSLI